MRVDFSQMIELPNDHSEAFIQTIENSTSPQMDLVCCILTNNRKDHALQKYHQVNGVLPAKIIIYRDGVNDIQLLDVIDSELPTLNELCMKAQEGYE
ncbi:unnamed protein product [Rotaria sp. Silwood2]|nr:unnamed protein product [Rotaria sp. Silwood2]